MAVSDPRLSRGVRSPPELSQEQSRNLRYKRATGNGKRVSGQRSGGGAGPTHTSSHPGVVCGVGLAYLGALQAACLAVSAGRPVVSKSVGGRVGFGEAGQRWRAGGVAWPAKAGRGQRCVLWREGAAAAAWTWPGLAAACCLACLPAGCCLLWLAFSLAGWLLLLLAGCC